MDKSQGHHRRHQHHAYGGGTGPSRGAGIGGEAVLRPGKALRPNILDIAAAILSADRASARHLQQRGPSTAASGESKLPLAELGRVPNFRPDTWPMNFQSELMVTRHYTPREYGFTFTNGNSGLV